MSFTQKTWKDRISEYPTRRTLTNTSTSDVSTVTVAREEGTISQQGDAFSAANMNDLENRVGIEFSTINSNFGGTTFSVNANGAYVHYTPTGGADPVVKKLGEYTLQDVGWIGYGYASAINIAAVLPDMYKKLTTSNFVAISFRLGSANNSALGPNWNNGMIPVLSYDSTTGILTISNYSSSQSGGSTPGKYGLGLHMAAIYI